MDIYWWASVPVYSQYRVYLCGFLKIFGGQKSFCGATDTPVLDFWWRVLWFSRIRVGRHSLRVTSHLLRPLPTSWRPTSSSTSVSVRNVYEVDLGLDTLVSRHRDVISIWKIELKSFLQMNTHDFVILFDVMQFSQDVQMDLAMWVKSRNECGRWRHCAKYSVLCRNECHH